MLRDGVPSCNEKEKDYVSEKVRSASWLIRSLYQRQRTLYKVVESIVKHQQPFFRDGVTKLAPLILKDIADDIGMHESTVSRITTNKYVATPHGIFELKFFFNSGLELDDGSQVGSESVKAPERRAARRAAQGTVEGQYRTAHGGQVPHGAEHPLILKAQGTFLIPAPREVL